MKRTSKARRKKLQKMAGLVDYGVDSDRESNDSSNNTATSNKAKLDESNSKSDLDEGKARVTNSKNNSKSSKSGHSKEVGHKNSSSKSKTSDHHHKHHKRSRSREKDSHSSRRRRSRSRDRKSHRHRDEKKKKRRSRSRSKTRSRSRSRSRSPTSHRRDRNAPRRTRSQEKREKKAATIARMGLDVTNVASSLAMSADDSNVNSSVPRQEPFASSLSTSAAVQAAAQKVLQNRVAVAQQATGVALPSFYNPAAVNPMKYAEQIQKRKLLWSNKEKVEQPTTSTAKIWGATAFTQDQDGKMTAKFKRLMGIKNDTPPGEEKVQPTVAEAPESSSEVIKKQQELFASLDQQYQIARATTHTQRGLGLGFSSNSSYPR